MADLLCIAGSCACLQMMAYLQHPRNPFLLKPIPDLEFHEDIHRYRYQGDWIPWSVSRIAQPLSPEDRANIDAYKHGPMGWQARGNFVHDAAERRLLGQELPEDPEGLYSEWVKAIDECWLLKGCEVLATEFCLVDKRGRYAGSFDALIKTPKGSVSLVDFKSVSSVKSMKTRKPALAQLGGYASMLLDWAPHISIDKLVTCVIAPGESRVISTDVNEGLMAWGDAWDAFKLLECPF